MLGCLPAIIDPVLLAEKSARLEGQVAVKSLLRLRAILLDESGVANVNLVFARTEGSRVRRMHGTITVPAVNVTCQRCLEPMQLGLTAAPDTILLREGEAEDGFAPEAEILTFGPAPVALAELIEDELLLVLPMVPMHALEECPARHYVGSGVDRKNAPAGGVGDKTKRPFAALARPKRDQK